MTFIETLVNIITKQCGSWKGLRGRKHPLTDRIDPIIRANGRRGIKFTWRRLLIGLDEAFLGRDRKPFCVPRLDNRVRERPKTFRENGCPFSCVCASYWKNLDKVSRGFYEEDATHVLHYYSRPKAARWCKFGPDSENRSTHVNLLRFQTCRISLVHLEPLKKQDYILISITTHSNTLPNLF